MTNLIAGVWQSLIVCGVSPSETDATLQLAKHACQFGDLILLTKNLINDLVILSTLFATAAFIFAGFKLVTSGGDPGAMKSAKDILMKVLKGYLWILVAWLLVYTITSALLNDGYSILGQP